MTLWEVFKRKAREAPKGPEELFDDEFQRRLDYLAVVSRRLFAGKLRAERKTRKSGSGVEFADHREYVPGDDLRYLDWNVYGRSEKLLLRLFEEEEDLAIYVLLDCSGSMAHGGGAKFNHARRLAAALAYVGLSNLDRVAVIAWSTRVSERLPPARGRGQIFKTFEFLRAVTAKGETALAEAAKAFTVENKRRGVAIIVSDLYDPAGFERGINAIRYQKFEPMVVHVTDSGECELSARGDLLLVDTETGDSREVTLTDAMVARYKTAHAGWRAEAESFCKTREIPYVAADLRGRFEDQVLGLFRRVGMVR